MQRLSASCGTGSAHGALPATWSAIPAGRASVGLGSRWLKEGAAALLQVPSVIVPEESVVVINPAHRDTARLKASVVRPFEYQRIFR